MTATTGERPRTGSRPIPPPRVDPRMRERWVAARRAEGRRRLRILVAVGSVALVALAAFGVVESPLTAISTVRVSGDRHETLSQVEAVAGLNPGRQMIAVNARASEARLERLPWVATATVTRHWLHTVSVQITERLAVAQLPAARSAPAGAPGSLTVLVDASGRVLSEPAPEVPGLPLLEGVGVGGAAGTWVPGAPAAPAAGSGQGASKSGAASPGSGLSEALAVAAMLPPTLAAEVNQLKISGGTLTAEVTVDGASASATKGSSPGSGTSGKVTPAPAATVPAEFGDPSSLAAKVTALSAIIGQVNLTHVNAIDLRIPGRPVLTGSPQPYNVSSTAGG